MRRVNCGRSRQGGWPSHRDLGTKLDPGRHTISVDDEPVRSEKTVYWLVHKPVGYLCTNHDPARRPLAIDLIPRIEQRVYTVGRLDEASEGLFAHDQRRRTRVQADAPEVRD